MRLLLLFLVRGRFLVNRPTVLILYLGRLEHFVAFSFLTRVFVVARLTVNFRLIEVWIEIAGIRPIAYVHHEAL